MYKVYWTELAEGVERPVSVSITELTDMLATCANLRKRRREGESISYITSVSENPDVVGEAGVDTVKPDYDWTKRRGGTYKPRIKKKEV